MKAINQQWDMMASRIAVLEERKRDQDQLSAREKIEPRNSGDDEDGLWDEFRDYCEGGMNGGGGSLGTTPYTDRCPVRYRCRQAVRHLQACAEVVGDPDMMELHEIPLRLHKQVARWGDEIMLQKALLQQARLLCVQLFDAVRAYATSPIGLSPASWVVRNDMIATAGARLSEVAPDWQELIVAWRSD